MVDNVDKAEKTSEMLNKASLANSKNFASKRKGPKLCIKCNEFNDRAELGYAVCEECFNALHKQKTS